MKKFVAILAASLIATTTLAVGANAQRNLSYTAPYGTPTIDGKAESAWDKAEWTKVDLVYDKKEATPNTCKVKVMHDDKLIYFLAEVDEKTFGKGDAVEFYLDEDNCKTEDAKSCTKFSHLGVNLNGNTNKGSRSTGTVDRIKEHKVTNSGTVYTLEWSYEPLTEIVPGETIGFELMLNDNSTAGKFVTANRWNVDTANGEKGPNTGTKDYGKLILEAKKAPAPTTAEQTPDLFIGAALLAAASGAAFVATKKH